MPNNDSTGISYIVDKLQLHEEPFLWAAVKEFKQTSKSSICVRVVPKPAVPEMKYIIAVGSAGEGSWAFVKGDLIIAVTFAEDHDRTASLGGAGRLTGRLNGKEGIFPAAYISLCGGDHANAVFALIDQGGKGSLSHSELHFSLSDFGLFEQRIERLIAQTATHTDGIVSKPEFIAGWRLFEGVVDRASDLDAGIRVPTAKYEVS